MRTGLLCVTSMLLLSCSQAENANNLQPETPRSSEKISSDAASELPNWELLSSGEGVSLALETVDKKAIMRLFCPTGEDQIKVNVRSFRPIASEERFSVGSGNAITTLVADARGDAVLGGVSGTGPVPNNLAALVTGKISVNYGAQNSGPHVAPSETLAKAFVMACNDRTTVVEPPPMSVKEANACLVQDGRLMGINARRAIGTEPFWGAKIEGRCVHYSNMENPKGTRVWTRYTRSAVGEVWSGTLGGKPFKLRIQSQPNCSDGMSDRRYPFSVELNIDGELRRGCAEKYVDTLSFTSLAKPSA